MSSDATSSAGRPVVVSVILGKIRSMYMVLPGILCVSTEQPGIVVCVCGGGGREGGRGNKEKNNHHEYFTTSVIINSNIVLLLIVITLIFTTNVTINSHYTHIVHNVPAISMAPCCKFPSCFSASV